MLVFSGSKITLRLKPTKENISFCLLLIYLPICLGALLCNNKTKVSVFDPHIFYIYVRHANLMFVICKKIITSKQLPSYALPSLELRHLGLRLCHTLTVPVLLVSKQLAKCTEQDKRCLIPRHSLSHLPTRHLPTQTFTHSDIYPHRNLPTSLLKT